MALVILGGHVGISIVIPAFNEEENISHVVDDCAATLAELPGQHEILVVDDASTDGTSRVLYELAERVPLLRVVRNENNIGCHPSLRRGFDEARGDWMLFLPGDRQIRANSLHRFWTRADESDIVCSYRRRRADPAYRVWLSAFYNAVVRAATGVPFRDFDSSVFIRRATYLAVADQLVATSASLSVELLVRVLAAGHRIAEVEIDHFPRPAGRNTGLNWRDISRVPRSLLRTVRIMRRARRGSMIVAAATNRKRLCVVQPDPTRSPTLTTGSVISGPGVFGLTVLLSVTARLVSWRPAADGAWSEYANAVGTGAVMACVVWSLARLHTRGGAPLLCAVAVLLAGDLVHYGRLLHPISRGTPVQEVSVTFGGAYHDAEFGPHWETEATRGGRAMLSAEGLRLESPAGGSAFMRFHPPRAPDQRRQWWLPVGLSVAVPVERLTWTASVERRGAWYVAAELRHLLIQVTNYGLHITYPDQRGELQGHEVSHSVGRMSDTRRWEVTRGPSRISLSLEGAEVWSAPQRGEITPARLGGIKTDAEHSGTMTLVRLAYSMSLGDPLEAQK